MHGTNTKVALLTSLFWFVLLCMAVAFVLLTLSMKYIQPGVLNVGWPAVNIAAVWFGLSIFSILGRRYGLMHHWTQWLWLVAPAAIAVPLAKYVMKISSTAVARPTSADLTAYATYTTLLIGVYLIWIVGYPLEECFPQTLQKRNAIALKSIFAGAAGVLLWITGVRAFAFVRRAADTSSRLRAEGLEAWIWSVLILVLIFLFIRMVTPLVISVVRRPQRTT